MNLVEQKGDIEWMGLYKNHRGFCFANKSSDAREIFSTMWNCSKTDIIIYKKINGLDDHWERV